MTDTPSLDTPTRLKRDEDGLIVGYSYRYTPEGRVDYLACVDRKHMFVIREREADVVKAQGKPINECDLMLVNEKWLRIKQAGFNQLLNLRGFQSIQYHSLHIGDGKAAVVCEIELIGNYESEGYPVICSAIASANTLSLDKNFRPYPETFAENRAFARCVKRALQIPVLSEDEIDSEAFRGHEGEDDKVSAAATPGASNEAYRVLEDLCTKRKIAITFDSIKARAIKHAAELTPERKDEALISDPNTWTEWASIPPRDVWLLTGKVKEADEAGRKKTKT